jgi:hypothetical protein
VHLTSADSARQIEAAGKIGGKYGIFVLRESKVPASKFGKLLKTFVPGDLSGQVRIAPSIEPFLRTPPRFGPVSLLRRHAGVRSTTLGSVDPQTGGFVSNEILVSGIDGQAYFRQATNAEILRATRHQQFVDYVPDGVIYGGSGLIGITYVYGGHVFYWLGVE